MGMFYGHNQSPTDTIKYGLLYNGYAANNINFAPSGWHVPTIVEWQTLNTYLGGESIAGGKMKAVGYDYWNSPNTGATNSSGFTAYGGGVRAINGEFGNFKIYGTYSSITYSDVYQGQVLLTYDNEINAVSVSDINMGRSIRLIKDSTTLSDGETSTMTDYDGNTYNTICIGTQEWTSQNWKCTHYNEGTSIPEVTGNSEWTALTTAALCANNNDWNYV